MTETCDPTAALTAILIRHGPLRPDDIAQLLRNAGVADPDHVIELLRRETAFPARQLVNEHWAWLPTVLAGRVFTRRVTADEVVCDMLTVTPDLDPIAALCDHEQYRRLADGSAIHRVVPGYDDDLLEQLDIPIELVEDGGVLALAAGTFEALGVDDGDLVGVRLNAAGLVVERVSTASQTTAGVRLAALLDDRPEFFDTAVWSVCAADPTLFTEPAVPLSEIAADHRLAQRGEWLAPPDFDFARWGFERSCNRLALRHGLDADDAFALNTLLRLYRRMAVRHLHESASARPVEPEASGFDEVLADAGRALADPVIAELLAVETVRHGRFSAGGLRLLAEALEPTVSAPTRVACRWLRAVALEREGDIAGFERELLAAQAMDADWPLTLLDLAHITSDRGDAEAGLALLHRAGATADHPLMHLLQLHRGEPRTGLGRNEPCWCGSGRKYKKCHLGHHGLALPDRVGWLYHKAIQHVLFGDWTELRHEVAFARCRSLIADGDDAFNAALADPLVVDALLFEGGGFEEFLAVRGALLPEDERALAERWLRVQRAVFEIEHVHRGGGVTVRDLCTGERHEVGERMTGHQLHRGQLACARMVSDGAGLQFFGLQPVSPAQRDPLIALLKFGADPVELVVVLSGGDATQMSAAR